MANKDVVTLVAVGDVGPVREHPGEIFDLTRPILKTADITFGQLERVLSKRGTVQLHMPPAPRGDPQLAKTLSDVGFDIMSFASNHTMDYSDDALLDTLDAMRKNNVIVIGAGTNIHEARQPAIVERNGIKVGFLAYCSVMPRGYEAGQDKPGVAPVRAITSYEQVDWQPGAPPRVISKANPDDLAAMVKDIENLRPSVDVLVVSMHWGIHFVPSVIAMYQREIGHAAIDAGADIIIGHHAHILKGIEVYQGKVLFFGLGNFATDWPLARAKTSPWYQFYGWEMDAEYTTYGFPIDSQKTILVKCTIADKKIQRVSFLPLWINKKGQPEPLSSSDPRSDKVFEYVEWLCRDQKLDTKFTREGDEIVVLT